MTPTNKQIEKAHRFIEAARMQLTILAVGTVKEYAAIRGELQGTVDCPLCRKPLRYSIAQSNGHIAARCSTDGCINARE